MKKSIYIISGLVATAFLLTLTGCKKGNEYPSKVVTLSYPTVTLNGPAFTTIARGSTWTDPGASWTDSVTGESGTVTFNINTSVDSVDDFYYIATNKNGFSNQYQGNGPPTRGVLVSNINSAVDISGTYNQNGPLGVLPATLTQVSAGLFSVDNVDGYIDPGVIGIKSDSTLCVATIVPYSVTFQTYVTSAGVPETFNQTSITYTAPISIQDNATTLNVPTVTLQAVHQRFGH